MLTQMNYYKLSSYKQYESVTRRQCEYAQSLAERTGSVIPTERQLLDYCTRNTMQEIIYEMKNGNVVSFIPVKLKSV